MSRARFLFKAWLNSQESAHHRQDRWAPLAQTLHSKVSSTRFSSWSRLTYCESPRGVTTRSLVLGTFQSASHENAGAKPVMDAIRHGRKRLPTSRPPSETSPVAMCRSTSSQLSTPIHKYAYVRCAVFGLGLGARREHTRPRSVTEEQQRPKPNTAQPSGRQVFLRQTSLLAPYRPLRDMLVARASSGTKISCRERMRIYELEY